MGTQSRRGLLKNAATAAVVATGGAMLGAGALAPALAKSLEGAAPISANLTIVCLRRVAHSSLVLA